MRSAITRTVRSVWFWVAPLVLLLGQVGVALSQTPDTVIFGPKQYTRTGSGSASTFTDTFTVPSTVQSPFLLHIVNGDSSGSHRISSGTITLNGVQVVTQSSFGS